MKLLLFILCMFILYFVFCYCEQFDLNDYDQANINIFLNESINQLLNKDKIYENTPNEILHCLSIELKEDNKGIGIYATKNIKKNTVISYYKLKVYGNNYSLPNNNNYSFTLYDKDENPIDKLTGELSIDSIPLPINNIPYWAHLVNEPSMDETENSSIDINTEENYKDRDTITIGDTVIYKLVADTDINIGDQIKWCYGSNYKRNYETSCKSE